MIRAVIFDLGGVVFPSPFAAFDEYDRTAGLPVGTVRALIRTSSEEGAWEALERGELTVPRSRRRSRPKRRSGASGSTPQALMASLGDHASTSRRCCARSARIRAVGLRTGAITNNWAEPEGQPRPATLDDLAFDVVIESAVVGLRKPDPRIYELALARARRRRARHRVSRRSRHQSQAGARARDDDDQGDRSGCRASPSSNRCSASR